MNKKYKTILLLLATVISFSQANKSFETHADSIFKNWNNVQQPGGAAGILKDGKIIYLKGFGTANLTTKEPITTKTKFQLGALSKQFTSLAILLLKEDEKINFKDDIRKYLSELPKYATTITIGHLLNHTSGLYDVHKVQTIINGTPNITTQKKALQLIAQQSEPYFKPGSNFSHHASFTESILMAEIVARVSKVSFANFVQQNIFKPLGMHNSLIRDNSNSLLANTAQPYNKIEGKNSYEKMEVTSSVVGAINAYCSAEDLAKWYVNYTNPKGKIGELIKKLDTLVQLSNGEKFNYYWGKMTIGRAFTHPERGLPIFWNFGLEGGYGTNVFRYTNQNVISFALGNSNQYNGALAMDAILPLVDHLYTQPPTVNYKKLKTKKLSSKELKAFEGYYWFKKSGYASKIFIKNDTLRNQWLFSNWSATLVPVSNNTFQQKANNEDVRLYRFKKQENKMKLFFSYNQSNPDVMERYTPVNSSKKELKHYVGSYYNETYALVFNFYLKGEELATENLHHSPINFKSITKDVFTSKSLFFNALSFFRNKKGTVSGFTINTDGIHGVKFKKIL